MQYSLAVHYYSSSKHFLDFVVSFFSCASHTHPHTHTCTHTCTHTHTLTQTHTQFMHLNTLKLICRARQLVHEGIKYMFDNHLVTVWSAPNYCYCCGNVALILAFDSTDSKDAKLFTAVPDSESVIPQKITTPYFMY